MRYYIYENERDKDQKNNPLHQVKTSQGQKQGDPQKTQTQGTISMNINPEFDSNERPNVEMVVEDAMGYLFNTFIKPREAELNEDDLTSVAMIGIMFKDIAEKAEAYYQMQEKGYEKNPNSLN